MQLPRLPSFDLRPLQRLPLGTIAVALAFAGSVSGCGNTLYLVRVTQAEEAFEEAKELEAEKHAPYQYYAAEAHLHEAKEQAAHAEYGNAARLSIEAAEFSSRAVILTKESRAKKALLAAEAPNPPHQTPLPIADKPEQSMSSSHTKENRSVPAIQRSGVVGNASGQGQAR